jgi:acetate---CoA ligase (ADP-forming) subunit alpha
MLESLENSPLYRIASPRSITLFGASNNILSMGTPILISLKAMGFAGAIYPVHPEEEHVQGLKAYRSVLDLPETPDLAILILPARIVPGILNECGKKGIKHAIIVSGGFKELGGNGIALENELLEIAATHGIRFLGPNCIGVTNPSQLLNTTLLQYLGKPGFIGMASQSGSFVTQMFHYLANFDLGFSTAFSVGNEANLDIVDCMEYLAVCPRTQVIALYIEGIKRGRAFVETAKTIVKYKPIVALYVGGSETGRRAGLSHTGALSGPDNLYDAMFRQAGIIRAQSITELFDFCWVLGTLPLPKGKKVVIQTHSGGPGAEAADFCGRAGLELPPLSVETINKISPFMPKTSSVRNPVDFTFTKNLLDYFSSIPNLLLEEDNADMLLIYLLMPMETVKSALEHLGIPEDQAGERTSELLDGLSKSIAEALKTHNKPLAGYTYRSTQEDFIRSLMKRGVPVFPSTERAVRALEALVRYSEIRIRISDNM